MANAKKNAVSKNQQRSKTSLRSLPRLAKNEISAAQLEEKNSGTTHEKSRVTWIIICAFVVLATFGVIVWFVFSGRPDLKIHGENLDNFTNTPSGPLAPSR